MAMPTWDKTMYPTLKLLSDGSVHLLNELCEASATHFQMSTEEQAERLASGRTRLYDRVSWGTTYLKKANLIEVAEQRGTFRITKAGAQQLESKPDTFDLPDLKSIPAFIKWKAESKKKKAIDDAITPSSVASQTPKERMDIAFQEINDQLEDELLERIMQKDPYFFEGLVTKLVVALGYGDLSEEGSTVTKKSGDGGIDGVVRLDRLGFDSVYIQAKRWAPDRSVTTPDLNAFVGALVANGASKGLYITTARFSSGARKFASENMRAANINLVLVDGRQLTKLMVECGIGVSVEKTYEVRTIDNDYFDSEL